MVKISYGITVHDEHEELKRLLILLIKHIRKEDDIVLVMDNPTEQVLLSLSECSNMLNGEGPNLYYFYHDLNNDFASHKNFLKEKCKGTHLFQIDADETISPELIKILPTLLEENSDIEMFRVPRINLVNDITEEHIRRWGWSVQDKFQYKNVINLPDYQTRIVKLLPNIKWHGKVHEIIEGMKNYTDLPEEEIFCLLHIKTIKKQEKQNNFYSQIADSNISLPYDAKYHEFLKGIPDKREFKNTTSWKFKTDLIDFFSRRPEFKEMTTLEIGTSHGYTTKILSHLFKKVITFDWKQSNIDLAKQNNEGITNIEFVVKDVYNEPWNIEENSIDVVFLDCVHTFEHTLQDVKNALKVLKKEGYLLFDDYGLFPEVKRVADGFMYNISNYNLFIDVVAKIGEGAGSDCRPEKILLDSEGIIIKVEKK